VIEDAETGWCSSSEALGQFNFDELTENSGKYIARPYNYFLNPILEERLDIERIFSFQSGGMLLWECKRVSANS
jgi:hypothetical protein